MVVQIAGTQTAALVWFCSMLFRERSFPLAKTGVTYNIRHELDQKGESLEDELFASRALHKIL